MSDGPQIIPMQMIYIETFTCREHWTNHRDRDEDINGPDDWQRCEASCDPPISEQIRGWVDQHRHQIVGHSPVSVNCAVENAGERIYYLGISVSYLKAVEGARGSEDDD